MARAMARAIACPADRRRAYLLPVDGEPVTNRFRCVAREASRGAGSSRLRYDKSQPVNPARAYSIVPKFILIPVKFK